MSPLETTILDELCQSKVTSSSVRLGVDLWDRGYLDTGDPVGLVEWVLRDLNERGFIKFRLNEGVLVDIRVEAAGFHAAGYRQRWTEVGQQHYVRRPGTDTHDVAARHPGDRTDFRTHGGRAAPDGPVERMNILDHMIRYPDHAHLHWQQLEEMTAP